LFITLGLIQRAIYYLRHFWRVNRTYIRSRYRCILGVIVGINVNNEILLLCISILLNKSKKE
jgi:hypothetical protein